MNKALELILKKSELENELFFIKEELKQELETWRIKEGLLARPTMKQFEREILKKGI